MCPPAARTSSAAPHCPTTGTPGRPVSEETVRSLVEDLVHRDVAGTPWHYCGVRDCGVVYFDADGRTIEKDALKVRVGEKEADAPHTVCYCFDHTLEDIEADIAESGKTDIPDSIRTKVQAGECSCEVSNPKGTCCLGDVALAVRSATKPAAADATSPSDDCGANGAGAGGDCCALPAGSSPADAESATTRSTVAALGLSSVTALGASACCWLPLLLVALGASSVGAAATFEGLRPYLLVIAPMLLSFSFYMLYVRRTPCGDEAACGTRRGSGGRVTKGVFWLAASLLIVSLVFPSAMSAVLGGSAPTSRERLATLPSLHLTVTGMTCETCSATARSALLKLPGVVDASADHEAGTARVWYESGVAPEHKALRSALQSHGYIVEAVQAQGPAPERR